MLLYNTYKQFDPTSSFGGYKESGLSREGGLRDLYGYVKLNSCQLNTLAGCRLPRINNIRIIHLYFRP